MVGRTPAETAIQCNCVQIQNVSCLHSTTSRFKPSRVPWIYIQNAPTRVARHDSARPTPIRPTQTGPGYGRTTHRNMATRPTMDLYDSEPEIPNRDPPRRLV